MRSEADQVRTRRLLEGLDCLVVQDISLTATAEVADVVFPAAAGWCESEGTVTSSERRVQRVRMAIPPRRRARRPRHPVRPRAAHGPRRGTARPGDDLERVRRLSPGARRDELRPPRSRQRPAVAVLRRESSRRAFPAQPPVGTAGRRTARAVPRPRERPAGGPARRRLPVPPDHRPAPRRVQHRRADRKLRLADPARRDARSLARGRRPPRGHERRPGACHVAARQSPDADPHRPGAAPRASPS